MLLDACPIEIVTHVEHVIRQGPTSPADHGIPDAKLSSVVHSANEWLSPPLMDLISWCEVVAIVFVYNSAPIAYDEHPVITHTWYVHVSQPYSVVLGGRVWRRIPAFWTWRDKAARIIAAPEELATPWTLVFSGVPYDVDLSRLADRLARGPEPVLGEAAEVGVLTTPRHQAILTRLGAPRRLVWLRPRRWALPVPPILGPESEARGPFAGNAGLRLL
jgi:hypothetical protein